MNLSISATTTGDYAPYSSPPPRRWVKIRTGAAISLGISISLLWYLLIFPFPSTPLNQFFYQRGVIQPTTLSTGWIVVVYCLLRYVVVKKEYSLSKKNWLLDNSDFPDSELQSIKESVFLASKSKSIIADRQRRVIMAFLVAKSVESARDVSRDDADATIDRIENAYLVVRTLIWAMPMLGFLGTVIGISISVSGFSGLLSGTSDLQTINSGLREVTTGLSTAFDTTLLGIVCAIVCMLISSSTERSEYELAHAVEEKIIDQIIPRLTRIDAQKD